MKSSELVERNALIHEAGASEQEMVLGLLTLMGPAALCNRLGIVDSSLMKWRRGGKSLPENVRKLISLWEDEGRPIAH